MFGLLTELPDAISSLSKEIDSPLASSTSFCSELTLLTEEFKWMSMSASARYSAGRNYQALAFPLVNALVIRVLS